MKTRIIQRDPDEREADSDHDERPARAARQLRHEPPRSESHRERSQPAPPPGEEGALVREPRAARRVACLEALLGHEDVFRAAARIPALEEADQAAL